MKNAFVILIYCLFLLACNNSKILSSESNKMTKAFIKSNIQIWDDMEGKINNYPDSVVLFSVGHYSVLCFTKTERFYDQVEGQDNEFIASGKEILKWQYFVFKKGIKYGVLMDSISTSLPLSYSADSLVKKSTPNISFNYDEFNKNWIKIGRLNTGDEHENVFVSKNKTRDTVKMSYSVSFRNVNFTMSNTFDSLEHSKMYKTEMVLHEVYDSVLKIPMPQRKIYIEIGMLALDEKEKLNIYNAIKIFDNFLLKN